MELGKFYAEKMTADLPFEYVLLDRRSAVDVATTLLEVQALIEPFFHRLFGVLAAVSRCTSNRGDVYH
jgi:hypothetical protein